MPKVIPTIYDGIKYRSRLEARWAVFFKAVKLDFEYEREAYYLPQGGGYLPDFWLPALGAYIEIKPYRDRQSAIETIKKLEKIGLEFATEGSGIALLLLCGPPDPYHKDYCIFDVTEGPEAIADSWDVCTNCSRVDTFFRACTCKFSDSTHHSNPRHPKLTTALETARTHRFWK